MKSQSPEKSAPNALTAVLVNRSPLSETAFEIELTRPPSFEFTAGQSIRFIHKAMERDYSLISAPGDPTLALCVRNVERGRFSSILTSAGVGAQFYFTGPHGYFTFRLSLRPAVFVATGTGIAPFVSMCRSGATGFTLLHGVRLPSDLYYQPLFRVAAQLYMPCLSGAPIESPKLAHTFRGTVTEYLERLLPSGLYDFYLCGRREMIQDVTLLVDERFPGSFVYTEVFY
ncbi:MAG: hypothetical protein JRI22_04760 [Deltaproteobacteria bacterium]|nr:hypothetical protein [Deltaproteobacteria bacterium]